MGVIDIMTAKNRHTLKSSLTDKIYQIWNLGFSIVRSLHIDQILFLGIDFGIIGLNNQEIFLFLWLFK